MNVLHPPSRILGFLGYVRSRGVVLLALLLTACGPSAVGPSPDFALSLNPPSLTLERGKSGQVTLNLSRENGFDGAVQVTLPVTPAGVHVAPVTLAADSSSQILTLSADELAALGSQLLELSAVSGPLSHPATLALTVTPQVVPNAPDFTLTLSPSSFSLKPGESAPLEVTLTRLKGFVEAVTVTVSNPPAGLSATSLTLPAGSSTGTLTVTAASSASPGSGTLTLQAVAGTLSHSATLPWTVLSAVGPSDPDFNFSTSGTLSVVPGHVVESTLTLSRQNGFAQPITLSLVNPPAGITGGPQTLPNGSSSAPFEVTVGATVPLGPVTLTFKAVGGGLTHTLEQSLTVASDPVVPAAPTLLSSVPANNATGVSVGTDVVLNFSEPMDPSLTSASFSPAGGATTSHWSSGNTTLKLSLLATLPGQPDNLYSSNTAYTVSVSGQDPAGHALGGSKSFTFTTAGTTPDTTAPTVLSTLPQNAAQNVTPGAGQSFSATFSEKMDPATLSAIVFAPSAGSANCAFSDQGHTTVKCTPGNGLAANTLYTLSITITAKDLAGNALSKLVSSSFTTGAAPDTTAPTVVSTVPVNAGQGVLAGKGRSVSVTFSEKMDPATLSAVGLSPSAGATNCAFTDATQTTVKCTPSVGLDTGQLYLLSVGTNAKDVAGNQLAQTFSSSFTTAATVDTTAPTLSSLLTSPADGSKGLDPNPSIVVQFSEPMDQASSEAAFNFIDPLTPNTALTFSWNAANTVLTVNPNTPFSYGQLVWWSVKTGATDLSGNALAPSSATARNFKIIQRQTIGIVSDGTLDGTVASNGSVDTSSAFMEPGSFVLSFRGLVTFNLQKIPELASISKIESASLFLVEEGATCSNTSAYTVLGNVLAENIFYTSPSASSYGVSPIFAPPSVLSTNPLLGAKGVDVTAEVGFDVINRTGLLNRSQWRVRFAKDKPSDPTQASSCNLTRFANGKDASKRPALNIIYLFP